MLRNVLLGSVHFGGPSELSRYDGHTQGLSSGPPCSYLSGGTNTHLCSSEEPVLWEALGWFIGSAQILLGPIMTDSVMDLG